MRNVACKRSMLLVGFVLLLLAVATSWPPNTVRSATQFNIVLEYDETGDAIDPCDAEPPLPTCGHTGHLAFILEAAAQHWESIIEDNHEVLMRYRWVPDSDPSAAVVETDADGRPTEILLRFPASFNYFYDPTPQDDEEFFMQPRLYRTTHPQEQAEAFLFNALSQQPPEVFEVSYNGLELEFSQNRDLLTEALHEMGHGLGLAGGIINARPEPACTENVDPWFALDPTLTGGRDFSLRAFDGSSGDDCAHLDLGGITECKPPPGDQDTTSSEPSTVPGLTIAECTAHQALLWVSEYPNARFRPGTADILAIALAAGWEEINLPRKFTLGDGLWDLTTTWLGNRVPDVTNDVYIVNQQDEPVVIDSFEPGGVARNLTITDGNILNVFFEDFLVEERISLQGEGTRLTADANSHVDTFDTSIGSGAILDVPFNGFFDSFYITSFGEIRGGDGLIDVVVLQNNGLIRGNGGLLSFTSSSIDAPFDLDGVVNSGGQLQALAGDLSFDGEITDEVLGRIDIGPGHFITFTQGWTQQSSFNALNRLEMTGGDFEATVNGPSTLNGNVIVNQVARFTSDVEFGETGLLALDVGGLDPGPGHDQLNIDGDVELNGRLSVALTPAFVATPNDRYTLVTYGSRSGEFAVESLPVLNGGLVALLDYGDTQLDLVVGFAGADPDSPNCSGQVASSQAQEHGGMKDAATFHGYPSVKAFQDAIDEFCGG